MDGSVVVGGEVDEGVVEVDVSSGPASGEADGEAVSKFEDTGAFGVCSGWLFMGHCLYSEALMIAQGL